MGETTTLTGIVAGIVAVVTGAFTYLLSRRKNSGSVSTTDAETIFGRQEVQLAEYRSFMLDQFHLRDIEIAGLKEMSQRQMADLRARDAEIAALHASVETMSRELVRKDERIAGLERDGLVKDQRIQSLEVDKEELRTRVKELERIDAARDAAARAVVAAHESNPQGGGL